MGFKEIIKNARALLSKETQMFNAGDNAIIDNSPILPNWFWQAHIGMSRGINIVELRQFAKSAWIVMIKNAIKKQVMSIEWDVVNSDEEDEIDYSKDIEKIKRLLNHPNRNGQTFWELWNMFLDDVLDIDAGVVWKGRNVSGELVELFAHDGSRFLYKVEEHGIVEGYYQYSYRFPRNQPIFFEKEDIIYGKMGLNTEHYPYGWSPLQSVVQEIEVMINSTRWNREFFKNNAVPDGIVSVPMERDAMERFKMYWDNEVKGKAHKLIFHNSDASFVPLAVNNKEMEWLEGQKWYFHLVFAIYGLSPAEVGFYEDVKRSAQEGQERTTIRNAIRPYLKLIEEKINNEILPELINHDKIMFKWFPDDHVAEKNKHDQMMQKLQANVLTINEVRRLDGLEPVEWGDKPMSLSMQENFISSQSQKFNEEKQTKPEKEKEKKEESLPVTEKKSLYKQIEVIEKEESKDYADFLEKKFNSWEKKIFSFIDETLSDELTKDVVIIEKSFSDFMRRLFNVVNTADFFNELKSVIMATYKTGINEAEKELNIDIGFKPEFEQEIVNMTKRQLDGFYVNGKPWQGLKGVSHDLQREIREELVDAISKHKSLHEMKETVKEIMIKYKGGTKLDGTVTDGRAMRIARTESNKFINEGKLKAFKESGLSGKKRWNAFIDDRTSNICKHLNGQTVGLYEEFIDPSTGFSYNVPPSHPNCRSIVEFILDE